MSSQEKMDFFEVGDKTSLICADPNTTESVKATLRELGFKYHVAETPELAVERMGRPQIRCSGRRVATSGTRGGEEAIAMI